MDDLKRELLWEWGLLDLWWRGFWQANAGLFDLVINEIVVGLIIYAFLLMGLGITRRTEMGRWIGNVLVTIALAFVGTILSLWLIFFGGDPWRYIVRAVIVWVALKSIFAMKTAFGGWLPLHRRAWHNLQGMMRRRGYHQVDDVETTVGLERDA